MGIDDLLEETYAEHLSRAGAIDAAYLRSQRVVETGRALWLKFDVTPR
jgi:iron complex outermembrane receptor protein